MANRVRFVDNVSVSAFGNTGTGGGSSVSSSYAETASFAQSGNGNFSGSFSGSFQGDGSSLTGVTGEWDGSHSGSASITGSLTLSGSYPGTALTVETYKGTLEFEPAPSRTNENVKLLLTGKGSGATDVSLYKNDGINEGALSIVTGFSSCGFFYELQGSTTSTGSFDFVPYSNPQTATAYGYVGDVLPLSIVNQNGYVAIGYSAPTHAAGKVPAKLSVSGSAFIADSILAPLTVEGSGSTLFDVQGSAGQLFSVSDGLIGTLMEVNDISGISLFQVSSSGLVQVNVGDISGSATSTASFGTYLGDGSQLTGIDPFPFTGDAEITGSLTISGSFSSFTLDSDNVVLGAGSGLAMQAGADSNIIIGSNTATSLTTGDFNVILGDSAGAADTNAQKNVLIGQRAGGNSTSLSENIFIGNGAGRYGSGLSGNVGIGQDALKGTSLNNGDNNVGIGWQTGLSIEDGIQNVFIGYRAAEKATTGNYNVIVGSKSGFELTTGANNITIGPDAGNGVSSGNRNIAIGYSASFSGDVSDQLVIGSGSLATISASLVTGDIVLQGDVSSSAASTASFGTYLGDGSQLSGISTTPFPFSGSAVITGSLVVSGSSKPIEVIGSGSTVFSVVGSLGELFAIDDQLSGSLLVVNDSSGLPQFEVFSDGRTLIGASPRSLYTTATINSTTAATSQSIYSLSTSSYDGVFFDYTVTSASNARAGNIMSIWNGGSIVYTENTTTDIGSTTGVNFDVIISQSQAQLISVTDTAGWKIKTTIRSI